MKTLPFLALSVACLLAGFYPAAAQTVTETNYIFDPGLTGTGSNGGGTWDNATADFSTGTSDTTYPVGGVGTTTGTAAIGSTTLTLTAGTIANVLPGQFLSSTAFPVGTYVVSISGDVVTLSNASTVAVNNNTSIIFTPSTNETSASGTVSSQGNGVNAVFGGTGFTGTPGTVTVSGTQYADNMTINSAGYTFTGGTIVVGSRSGSAGDLYVDASATINSALTVSGIFFGNGTVTPSNATLTLTGGSTSLGTIQAYNNSQSVADSSTIILSAGNYTINNNEINIGNAATGADGLVIDTGATLTHNYMFVGYGSTGLVTVNGGTLADGTGSANGPLVIGRAGAGRVILESGTITNTNTANGGITIGMGAATANGELDVEGGTLTSTLVGIGSDFTSSGDIGTWNISGGTSTVGTISYGAGYSTTTTTAGTGTINLTGGTLYVGAGGIVNVGTGTFTATTNLSGGTVGATANWSSSVNMNLNPGTVGVGAGVAPVTFQAANSSGTAENITLSGVLSGTGGFNKTGAGTLNITGLANTYSGPTFISAGTLSLASGGTSSVEVGAGATLQLNLNTSMASTATLTLDSATTSAVIFNYSVNGTDAIGTLTIDGVQIAAGVYTAAELDAMSVNGITVTDFTDNSGDLNTLTVGMSAVPEPSTWAMFFLGLGALAVLARRRRGSEPL